MLKSLSRRGLSFIESIFGGMASLGGWRRSPAQPDWRIPLGTRV
jgi:hypothetical protein